MNDELIADGDAGRRQFLKATGLAALGATTLSRFSGVRAQNQRREIFVDGQRATVVDIHAHCVFPELEEIIAGTRLDGQTFPGFVTLGPERIDAMNTRGIDIQALSVNAFWWYEGDRALASRIVDLQDRRLAQWCERYPERFVALTSPALQFPELAAEQLEYAVTELGAKGASIGGHVHFAPPTSAHFDPFWAKAEALDVPVFMHPNNSLNIVRTNGLAGRGGLGNIVGNPLETTVFLTHMIFDGTLDRFPGLKIVAAHGGGYLPSYLGRSDVACTIRPADDCANERDVRDYFTDQIFVDSMVFSDEGLRHLVAETDVSQVVYGSDLPYNWPDTIDVIAESPHLSADDKLAILGGNLLRMLRIDA
ncbi:MAG TPA: amidohydrolase family protein [Gammaproteobacteria bacterium]|nr:amidohydrolase family protein [Gammaproteobacteria bacterium]